MTVDKTMIRYPAGDISTPAFLASPGDGERHPAVIAIQEWWGLVPHIKEVTERFAEEGYIALAPDLYHGQVAEEPDEARKLAMALQRDQAVAEIQAAVSYLSQREDVAPDQIGLVGWCMGGGLALSTAAAGSNIGAVVSFYGRPLSPADCAKIGAPVLGLYAGTDHGIPLSEVQAFESDLKRYGVPHEIHIYQDAHHAFFNDTRPIFDRDAAEDAWRRTLEWFERYLH